MVTKLARLLGGSRADIPSLSPKEETILRLLVAGGELYGLEIVAKSEGAVGRGTVYVTLARMQEKGYVDSHQEEQAAGATGLPRRRYKVTGEGARVLRTWDQVALAFSGGRLAT
jgi:DNA-binding PadR family transcriptional regulator